MNTQTIVVSKVDTLLITYLENPSRTPTPRTPRMSDTLFDGITRMFDVIV